MVLPQPHGSGPEAENKRWLRRVRVEVGGETGLYKEDSEHWRWSAWPG